MRRFLTGFAGLGLILAFAGAGWEGPAEAGKGDRQPTVCFSTVPAGTDNVIVLEFTSRGRFSGGVTGVIATTIGFGGSPPQPTIPIAGGTRPRADGKLEFTATGLYLGIPLSLSGILDPPDFNEGNGLMRLDLDPVVSSTVTYFPLSLDACEGVIADFPDPSP